MEMLRWVGLTCYSSLQAGDQCLREREKNERETEKIYRRQWEEALKAEINSLWVIVELLHCKVLRTFMTYKAATKPLHKPKHMAPRIKQTDTDRWGHKIMPTPPISFSSHLLPPHLPPPLAPLPPFREAVFKQRNALCFFSGVCMSPHAHPRVLTTSRLVFSPN